MRKRGRAGTRVGRVLLGCAAILAAGQAAASPDPAKSAADAWRDAHEKQILSEFSDFVAIPDVATNISDVERNAAHLQEMLRSRGFTTAILSPGQGTPPTVFAQMKTPGARRTVLFYAHYDGQPISQKGWLSEPFSPVMRTGPPSENPGTVDWRAASTPFDPNWRLYARAAADDKVTIEALLSAMDALHAANMKPSVNIKLFYEGEEEQGSPHLQAIIDKNKDLLAADLVVMGDGPMHQSGRQLVNFGSRGIVSATLTVFGPSRPLHDGHYGSWAPNPAVEIAGLISSLRQDNGDIEISRFYDDVRPPTSAEMAAMATLPHVEDELARGLGIIPITTKRLADSYFRPTLNVRAIHAGDAGPDAANAIATSAYAAIDFRIVPDETPEHVRRLTETYLAGQGWLITHTPPDLATRLAHPRVVMIKWDEGDSPPVRTDMRSPAALAAVTAIQRVEDSPVLQLPMVGASSGLGIIVAGLNTPMVGVSIANYDDNQHAENENIRLANLWDGIDVYAALLSELDW